jgi:hypothetical protein
MRYELSDDEWATLRPMLPNKPRGLPQLAPDAQGRAVTAGHNITATERAEPLKSGTTGSGGDYAG